MSVELAPKGRESQGIYVLIFLLLLHLILLSLQIEDPTGAILVKKWVLFAGAPFISLFAGVTRGVGEVWINYVWLHGAREENARLHQAVGRLLLEARSLEQARQENERLRRLLAFKENASLQSIGARVVARAPDFLSRVVYLDRGEADGVRADCAVVTDSGIVGRVILASTHSSQVQLITNADASVGVVIERTGVPGVLRGSGGHMLEIGYIGGTEDVAVGDLVLTSGLDRIYPKGLPVGRVIESARGKTVFREIRVEPAADLLRIDEVLILLGAGAPPP